MIYIFLLLFYHDEFILSSNSLLLIKLERLLKEIFEEYLRYLRIFIRSQNLSLSLENLRQQRNEWNRPRIIPNNSKWFTSDDICSTLDSPRNCYLTVRVWLRHRDGATSSGRRRRNVSTTDRDWPFAMVDPLGETRHGENNDRPISSVSVPAKAEWEIS